MALYSIEIGAYEFEATPSCAIDSERIVRRSLSPNEAVAINYTFSLVCRIRSTDALPDNGVAGLLTALAAWHDTRTCPAFVLRDADDEIVSPFNVSESADLGWEDVRLVSFSLPADPAQLVAGATFSLVIQARRSFPDSDGICEYDATHEVTADEFGNEVQRLAVSFRFAKASITSTPALANPATYTDAIKARLRLAAPPGYVRTVGSAALGFSYEHPLYPLTHVVNTVSEVRTTGGVTGSSGATSARTETRRVVDPEKGLVRVTESAETSGGEDPEAWVRGQRPGAAIVSEAITVGLGSTQTARGEWTRIESFRGTGKTTDVTRTYALRGGRRALGATAMTPPLLPHLARGPFEPYVLSETVEVRAKGATALGDFELPGPLTAPWVLGAVSYALPRVEESAVDPNERLWLWVVTREYLWDDVNSPLLNSELAARMFADGLEEGGQA